MSLSETYDNWLYDAQMKLYEIGLRSTPPIVLPAEGIKGRATVVNMVEDMETKNSHTAIIAGALSDSAKEVGSFMKVSLPIILVSILIIYFLVKKEMRTA